MKSFYWHFRPTAVLSKCLGVFPLENVLNLDASLLNYKLFSWSNLYSLIIFTFYINMLYFCSGFIFDIPSVSHKFLCYVVYVMVIRSFLSFMCCSHNSRKAPKLIRLLDTFDRKKHQILVVNDYSTTFNVFMWMIIPNLVSITFLYLSLEEAAHTWQIFPYFIYLHFAVKITYNFIEINNTLVNKNMICDYLNKDINYDPEMYVTLSKIRMLHNMLSECVTELGKCYGTSIALDQLCITTVFIVNISVYVYEGDHNTEFSKCNHNISVIFVSDELKVRGSEVISLLYGIPSTAISEKTQQEINSFLTQLAVRPIEVSAAGYFVLDKSQTLATICRKAELSDSRQQRSRRLTL
ncbi:hypothetical protein NQ318_007305 [Aromia moschata]|uniref:Gustatory receptor n=1 Tax=Aromia moschata TaxID=1265417 RepID=A0AAV8Z0H3_9CUCU|nr:hypothetical protein NQ318_007305 [Aromia moschata]